jgi:hypothetical protein
MADMPQDLDQLEKMLRQLQIEWEKFFGGVEKKPPVDLRMKVEQIVRRYAGVEVRNNMDRFRYQTLTARYNTFNELWQKRLRAIEEGRVVGLHVTKAMLSHVPASVIPPEPEPAPRAARPPAAGAVAAGAKEYRIQNPSGDGTMVKAL